MAAAGKEVSKPKSVTVITAELGIVGLYKGAAACLLRDIPFSNCEHRNAVFFVSSRHFQLCIYLTLTSSKHIYCTSGAIYFPAYTYCKNWVVGHNRKMHATATDLLLAQAVRVDAVETVIKC